MKRLIESEFLRSTKKKMIMQFHYEKNYREEK